MTAKVYYADLWGEREIYEEDEHGERVLTGGKYGWLWQNEASTTEWVELEPQSPFYLFAPQDKDLRDEYETKWSISDIFPINGVGMTTARDHLVIDFEPEPLAERARIFRDSKETDEELCRQLDISMKKGWDIARSRRLLKQETDLSQHIVSVQYRPFDGRRIFYHDSLVWRTVKQIMIHMLAGENLGLITTRQTRDQWDAFATRTVIGHKAVAAYDINSLFPLYLYPTETKANLFDDEPSDAPGGRRPNLAPGFVADLSTRLKLKFVPDGKGDLTKTFGPEDVFHYAYAVFHSPAYRARYSEFLKIDFPRLPLTSDRELFRELAALGERLTLVHLLEEDAPPLASFPRKGTNEVEQVRYTAPGEGGHSEGRVWINREQFFAGVPAEVWSFHVGGYQVAQKWLKDRKGRALSYDDLAHYQRTLAALAETIRLMSEVDAAIDARGGWPLK